MNSYDFVLLQHQDKFPHSICCHQGKVAKYWIMKTTISIFGITREFIWITGETCLPSLSPKAWFQISRRPQTILLIPLVTK